MSVYVDTMRAQYGRMVMCHMIADSREELDAMADAIGVKRKWIQHEGKPTEHYDICLSKRVKAISLGALPLDRAEFVKRLRAKRASLTPSEKESE